MDRAVEVGRDALWTAHKLPFAGHWRRAWLGKRARVCTFAGGLPNPLSPGPTGSWDIGTAYPRRSDLSEAERAESQAISRSISWRDSQDTIGADRSPGAAASAGQIYCRQFGR